jgi:hypothetical protein
MAPHYPHGAHRLIGPRRCACGGKWFRSRGSWVHLGPIRAAIDTIGIIALAAVSVGAMLYGVVVALLH